MNVFELNVEQMNELKANFVAGAANNMNLHCDYADLDAASRIPDELICSLYRNYSFCDEDFGCSAG